MIDAPNESAPPSTLTEKLHSLSAEERVEMEGLIAERGVAYILAQWGTLLAQLRYIDSL